MADETVIGTIVSEHSDKEFKIQRNGSSDWKWYDPNEKDAKTLKTGDMLYVKRPVTVKLKCKQNETVKKVAWEEEIVVDNICSTRFLTRNGNILPEIIAARYFNSEGEKSQQQIPQKIGEISDYPVGKKFQIKRNAWADFKDYNSSWGSGLYEGDQLIVPPGVTVKVKFEKKLEKNNEVQEKNNEVPVTDNNQPWDAIDHWQSL